MLNTKKITIFGCGWLGFPLAMRLIKKGHTVLGTTTQGAKMVLLEREGIKAFKVDLMKEDTLNSLLFQSEILVLAFPPKIRSTIGDWYVQAVKRIVEAAKCSSVKRFIMLSSTSVYPDVCQVMTEEYDLSSSISGNAVLVEAEQAVSGSGIDSIVLRLGGLAGDDRWLARHFSGKTDLPNGSSPVNLLHKEDALHVIEMSIENAIPIGIYNICSPEHPTKEELYTKECREAGWALPHYKNEAKKGGKIISVEKWLQTARSTFIFNSPFDYTYVK